jgi:primary-amine oxidase
MRSLRFVLGTAVGVLSLASCNQEQSSRGRDDGDATATSHPLDPLSESELGAAVDVLRASGRLDGGRVLTGVWLREPPKQSVVSFAAGDSLAREALAVLVAPSTGTTSEAVIDVRSRRLVSWRDVPEAHARTTNVEYALAVELLARSAEWARAFRARGIALDSVYVALFGYGGVASDDPSASRRVRALPYYGNSGRNVFGRPIEGVMAVINLTERRVERVIDSGVRPVAGAQEFDTATVGSLRPALAPLSVEQPDGPGFRIAGHEVRWDRWRFRYAIHPREGVVLYTVGLQDGDSLRAILYRASLSEMAVPYGDPDENWRFRVSFDLGEYYFGWSLRALQVGADVPRHATLLDGVLLSENGSVHTRHGIAALYERDGGLLWRHDREVRRGRELVLRSVALVGNYDYGLSWVFRQDGTLAVEVDLTGIMLAKGVAAESAAHAANVGGTESRFGSLVAPRVVATNHQHFFGFRLDFDIDGASDDAIVEMNTRPLPAGAGNPAGNAFVMEETVLRTEREAQRDLELAESRSWKVVDAGSTNALGLHPGYALLPGVNSTLHLAAESPIRRRAGFTTHHVWGTSYAPSELYAAGDYPNQSRGGDGLLAWVASNDSLERRDVVLWYTMGVTHIPRAEEWPVMPVARAGFALIPTNFFVRNPALDVPPER